MSPGISTHSQRITRSDFRLCLTRRSHSQACFCPCTHQLVSNQPEQTLERLRYILGGDRPSQPTHLPRSPHRITVQVSIPDTPGWCSIGARRLPPTLYKRIQNTMTGCSKAPWGLSVLRRVMRIFTHATISPSLSLENHFVRISNAAVDHSIPVVAFRNSTTLLYTSLEPPGTGGHKPSGAHFDCPSIQPTIALPH